MFRFSQAFLKLSIIEKSLPLSTVIAVDPGAVNSAICVLAINPYHIARLHMIPRHILISSFKENETRVAAQSFMFYIESLILEFKPTIFVSELFFSRGARNNNQSLCMFMLGLIVAVCHQHGVKAVVANSGVWKSAVNRVIPIQQLYALKLKKYTHMVDALLIALYADKTAYKTLGKQGLIRLVQDSDIPNARRKKTAARSTVHSAPTRPTRRLQSTVRLQ